MKREAKSFYREIYCHTHNNNKINCNSNIIKNVFNNVKKTFNRIITILITLGLKKMPCRAWWHFSWRINEKSKMILKECCSTFKKKKNGIRKVEIKFIIALKTRYFALRRWWWEGRNLDLICIFINTHTHAFRFVHCCA